MNRRAFTLIELIVTLGILAVLATLATVTLLPTRVKARDSVRKTELNTIGRYLWATDCYVPTAGPGDYDVQTILDEFIAANPQAASFVSKAPRDPKSGTESLSGYHYVYEASGRCVIYANLESASEPNTLSITAPTAGGGNGVFEAPTAGPNGTVKYYQVTR